MATRTNTGSDVCEPEEAPAGGHPVLGRGHTEGVTVPPSFLEVCSPLLRLCRVCHDQRGVRAESAKWSVGREGNPLPLCAPSPANSIGRCSLGVGIIDPTAAVFPLKLALLTGTTSSYGCGWQGALACEKDRKQHSSSSSSPLRSGSIASSSSHRVSRQRLRWGRH